MLGTADILEDLLLLGALDDKVVIGSMNRGGLAGTVFEIDDRFTGVRRRRRSPRRASRAARCCCASTRTTPRPRRRSRPARDAVNELADAWLMAMVEPFISHRVDGRVRNDLTAEAVIRSATVAAGLGCDVAHTWLKLPVVDDMDGCWRRPRCRCCCSAARSSADQDAQFAQWRKALANPHVRGMVVGRSLLYPPDGDVAAAVDATVEMM